MVASFLSFLACTMGKAAHPGDDAPAQATGGVPVAELVAKCDERGAPVVTAKKIKDCVELGRNEAKCMEPFWAEYLKGNAHSTKTARIPGTVRAAFQSASVGPVSPEYTKPDVPS